MASQPRIVYIDGRGGTLKGPALGAGCCKVSQPATHSNGNTHSSRTALFRGRPEHAQPFRDSGGAEVLSHDRFQRPPQSAARQLRPRLARGSPAVVVSRCYTCPQPVHASRQTVTSSAVGRQPHGS